MKLLILSKMVHNFSIKQNFIRALGVILPSLALCAIWMDSILSSIIAILFALLLSFLFLLRFSWKNSWLFTAIIMFLITFFYSAYDSLLTLPAGNHQLLFYAQQIFIRSGIFTVISFALALPAWLLFWGIDHQLCRWLSLPKE